MRMNSRQLQDGADWLYNQFYRLDRIIVRTVRAAFTDWPDTGILDMAAESNLSL